MAWRGVTDHLHILLAVDYEPVDGMLACRFVSGDPVVHSGVPENTYQILLRSKYAGAYYRKHIKGHFPCPFEKQTEAYQPTERPGGLLDQMLIKYLPEVEQ